MPVVLVVQRSTGIVRMEDSSPRIRPYLDCWDVSLFFLSRFLYIFFFLHLSHLSLWWCDVFSERENARALDLRRARGSGDRFFSGYMMMRCAPIYILLLLSPSAPSSLSDSSHNICIYECHMQIISRGHINAGTLWKSAQVFHIRSPYTRFITSPLYIRLTQLGRIYFKPSART